MTMLSSDHVLKDNNTTNPAAIESLTLSHRALSDVSCLSDFNNVSRLDLKLNKLTSLEGLKSCTNLKWLSVAENKLETLKGIEALPKLTVLNAGKNRLKSMDEVRSITTLCALILNDNEITSICMLDQMKDLNTLVLSKNPIGEIGQSLVKAKSITKLSLSHCQLQNINNSLKSCVELKELRLAHNHIKSLPAELAHNKNLLNLDLGYNVITRWSDLKVLSSLVILRNLNLQGNPIAAEDKIVKKIKNTLPMLHVFNAKPIDKYTKNEKGAKTDKNSSHIADENLESAAEKMEDINGNHLKDPHMDQGRGSNVDTPHESDKRLKKKSRGVNENASEEIPSPDEEKRNQHKRKSSKHHLAGESATGNLENSATEKQPKKKTEKDGKFQKRKGPLQAKNGDSDTEEKPNKKSKGQRSELDVIDDGEASFAEIFNSNNIEKSKYEMEKVDNGGQDTKSTGVIVTFPSKRKKAKVQGKGSAVELSTGVEVGMGGPSTWGDDE